MEADWKKFREMVPGLRERYLAEVNVQLLRLLRDRDKSPTAQFASAAEEIAKQAKILRACFTGHARSKMFEFICLMEGYGIITPGDLNEFSPELRAQVLAMKRALQEQ